MQHRRVGPQFRLRDPAAGAENADDVPLGFAKFHHLADVEPGKLTGRGDARNHLVAAGLKHSPLRDLHVSAHGWPAGLDAAKGDVGVGAGGSLGNINDYEQFGRGHCAVVFARHPGRVLDDPGLIPPQTAGHLVVRPVPQDDGDVVPTR